MIRVVKDPKIRRKELIDKAEQLFIKNGYDETAVSDIVKKAKVAQGTFYYYFKSKDEILDAIFDRYINEIMEQLNKIADDPNMSAVEKFFVSFKISQQYRGKHKGIERLVDYVHDEKHENIHHRMEKKNTSAFVNFYEKLIEQGISEGVFNVDYPHEAALAILSTTTAISHEVGRPHEINDEIKRLMFVILDLMERILGAKKGTFIELIKLIEVNK